MTIISAVVDGRLKSKYLADYMYEKLLDTARERNYPMEVYSLNSYKVLWDGKPLVIANDRGVDNA